MQPDAHSSQLPVFVYGTLLPNQPNAHLWGDAVREWLPAAFQSARLYSMGAYPMLVEAEQGTVRGMLALIKPDHYRPVLTRLDALERYDPDRPNEGPYRRRARPVILEDGSNRPAWLYLGSSTLVRGLPLVDGGDWAAHAARQGNRFHEWWHRHRSDYHHRPPGDLS